MTEPTNTAGTIQAAVAAAPKAPALRPVDRMKKMLAEDGVRSQLERVSKDHADLYAASIIELFTTTPQLQACDPAKVLMEALKAVSLQLPINKALGQAFVVPYGNAPTLIIGHKGYKQLALRTGQYAAMNEGVVYEGELKRYNKLTAEIDISGEAVSDKVTGYFSWFRLLTGFEHAVFWTREKVTAHAKRFSKSYNRSDSAWQTSFDEMAQKTVFLNNIRGWGVLSIEMQRAMMSDEDALAADGINAPENSDDAASATIIDAETEPA